MSADEPTAVVIDTGTAYTRGGFAGEETPLCCVPTAVCLDRSGCVDGGTADCADGKLLWGHDLQNIRSATPPELPKSISEARRWGLLGPPSVSGWWGDGEKNEYRRFLRRGVIQCWDECEGLWLWLMKKQLRLAPEEHPVMLTEPTLNPKINRELMTQSVFETFGVPAAYIALTSVLSLYGAGKTGGLVVEMGEGGGSVVPVVEGYVNQQACEKFDYGGIDQTALVMDLLSAKHNSAHGSLQQAGTFWRSKFADWESSLTDFLAVERLRYAAQLVKETNALVSTTTTDYSAKPTSAALADDGTSRATADGDTIKSAGAFALPDGQVIQLTTEERNAVGECLFDPVEHLCRNPAVARGVQHHIVSCVSKCECDYQRDLLGNLVISGGTSAIDGFANRLCLEVTSLVPTVSLRVKVTVSNSVECTPVESCNGVWIGGSILGTLSTFQQQWVTKDEYDESGPAIVHRKCCC